MPNRPVEIPESVLRFFCEKCEHAFYLEDNPGEAFCPRCMHRVKGSWGIFKLSFQYESKNRRKGDYHD